MPRWTPLLALVACPAAPELLDPDGALPATVGADRAAVVVGPSDYDGSTALPVVFLLGGYWYYAHELDEWIALTERVDAHDFVAVLPDGTVDDTGAPFWNATETCCDYYGSGVDDHAYLASLIAELEAEAAIDSDQIVFMGHSNGAFMAYSMACEPDSPVDAVVSIAGSSYLDADNCQATHGVHVLQVHGARDQVMPIEGDTGAPGAEEVLTRWAARNGCSGTGLSGDAALDLVDDTGDTDASASAWTDCAEPTELWRIPSANHYPEFHRGFVERVMDWLQW